MEYVPHLPLYIGLNVHTQTRSRKLIMELHAMGLSVSYDWILQLENQLATAVCEDIGVVCPAQLRKLLGALDNLDHNPSSTTAQGSFHGTGISPPPGQIWDVSRISLASLEANQKHVLPDILKTTNRFSAMPIDQAHEQNNELVWGAVGLTENPSAFRKWMIAGSDF